MPDNMSDAAPVVAFIILGILVFVIAALAVIRQIIDNRREENDEEYENKPNNSSDKAEFICEYHVFGGMEDENMLIRLEYTPGNNAVVDYIKRVNHGADTITKKISVPEETATKLIKLYKEQDISKLGKPEKSELQALDAPSSSITFITNGNKITINDDDVLPEGNANIIGETKKILRACIKSEN